MPDFFLRLKAKSDLLKIWNDTAERWDEHQADYYLSLINDAFQRLAQYPQLGPACDHINKGYQKLTMREHLIFYRITCYRDSDYSRAVSRHEYRDPYE